MPFLRAPSPHRPAPALPPAGRLRRGRLGHGCGPRRHGLDRRRLWRGHGGVSVNSAAGSAGAALGFRARGLRTGFGFSVASGSHLAVYARHRRGRLQQCSVRCVGRGRLRGCPGRLARAAASAAGSPAALRLGLAVGRRLAVSVLGSCVRSCGSVLRRCRLAGRRLGAGRLGSRAAAAAAAPLRLGLGVGVLALRCCLDHLGRRAASSSAASSLAPALRRVPDVAVVVAVRRRRPRVRSSSSSRSPTSRSKSGSSNSPGSGGSSIGAGLASSSVA